MLRYHSNNRNVYLNNDHHLSSISRTARYKKTEGENINKLEKADVLEMTVRYIKRISTMKDPIQEAHRFHAGFSECASEACKFLCSLPNLNSTVSSRLVEHLKQCLANPRPLETNFLTCATKLESTATRPERPNSADSASPSPSPSPPTKPNRNSRSSPVSPVLAVFKSYRYEDELGRNAHASRSVDEQKNNSMWRPW
ncbi:enhancer of split mgamma protein-like isoform X2 [Planococcus citri]|uniref:enhancer of split mgamma protein-like isoform X2 n=1 Tax=Planococcus citri TaxID=170843 RepID=UPI0031F80625